MANLFGAAAPNFVLLSAFILAGRFTSFHGVSYEPVGCYKDKLSDRALPSLIGYFRNGIDWSDIDNEARRIVRECADKANARFKTTGDPREKWFGVQYWGECYGGMLEDHGYAKHGIATGCRWGLGDSSMNFVYQIVDRNVSSPQLEKDDPSCEQFTRQGVDICCPNTITLQPPNASFVSCAKQCRNTTGCTGFNFAFKNLIEKSTCELFQCNSTYELVSCSGLNAYFRS